jgi:hypothetical protein
MRTILSLIVAATLCTGCEIIESGEMPTAPTTIRTLVITGPTLMDVGSTWPFTASWRASDSTLTPATGVQWTVNRPELLSLSSQGFGAALKTGGARITATSGGMDAEHAVQISPKLIGLVLSGLPPQMSVGGIADVNLIVNADTGEGERGYSVAELLGATAASSIQWSSLTQTTLSVSDSVVQAGMGIARATAPGTGRVQGSIAGFTATATTQIVGSMPDVTVPVSPLPPATTPADLNGVRGFDLRRGASDCGIGLRDSITGTLDVSGVPSTGVGGRARLNYGTLYEWLQLTVVLAGASEVLDFESESIPATVNGFQVYISGRLLVRERSGFLRFHWVQIGQPRSNACATFEGTMR